MTSILEGQWWHQAKLRDLYPSARHERKHDREAKESIFKLLILQYTKRDSNKVVHKVGEDIKDEYSGSNDNKQW